MRILDWRGAISSAGYLGWYYVAGDTVTFDAQGNGYDPCGVCGQPTMLGRLAPLTVAAGMGLTAAYDARPKGPTGSRSGAEPIWKRARVPFTKRVQACESCRSKR